MDWTASIDGYCERLDTGFWAEPVNAASNLAFVVAAIVVLLVIILLINAIAIYLRNRYARKW